MAYATYRLYYETEVFDEHSYYDALEMLDDDTEGGVNPDDFYVEESFCAAIIVIDLDPAPGEEQGVQVAVKPAGGPYVPEWYGDAEAELVHRELGHVLHARDDKTVVIRHPQDPPLGLEAGAVVHAEDFTAATLMAMDHNETDQESRLFPAFCIEFQPDPRVDPFPIAVFVLDPVDGYLAGGDFGPYNPFAPRSFNRAQRRYVDRQLALFTRKLTKLAALGPEGGLKRVRAREIMGPRFRTEGLPSMVATDVHEAMNQASVYLSEYWKQNQVS